MTSVHVKSAEQQSTSSADVSHTHKWNKLETITIHCGNIFLFFQFVKTNIFSVLVPDSHFSK